MLKTLHIFDMLPFIHAGHVNKYSRLERLIDLGSTWTTQVTPTGGCAWILKHVYQAMSEGDVVVCSDRTPTIKKEMLPEYKSNRDHKEVINVEKRAAEYILQKCNVSVLARAGYEADDIVYSIVKKFYNEYDKIYIYTGDSDLYFLVDDKVSIRPSSSRAKSVDRDNYERVAKKGGMKYNCMTTSKIIGGDSSDCIPALTLDKQYEFANAMYREEFFPHLGDKEFVKYWVNILCPWANRQVELVFPLDVVDLPNGFKIPNKQMLINFGDSMNSKDFKGRAAIDFDVEPYVVEMHEHGIYIEEDD